MKLFYYWALLLAVLLPLTGHAQLNGHNTRGDFGLHSGTQPPPGFYVVPLFYDYEADTLRDRNGDARPAIAAGGEVEAQAGIVGLLWVSEKKILGGNYAFSIWPGVINNAIAAPIFALDERVNPGICRSLYSAA